jgi:hypothetical protein
MAKRIQPSEPAAYGRARAALWGLAALGVPVLFTVWRPDFPQNEESEIRVKVVLAVIVVALLLIREFTPSVPMNRAGRALTLAAILAAVGYLNFGTFHGRSFIHHWEQFHYALGAKYFPELGYDGLYDASIEAQRSRDPGATLHSSYRDLRTNKVVATDSPDALARRKAVVARFSPERWRAFVADNDFFVIHNDPGYLASIRLDHGFNPPPSWTFVARLFAGWPAIDEGTLDALAVLDLLLLAALFVVVSRTYGTRWGCLALALFGTMRRELVDFSLPEPWILWQAKMDAVAQARRPLLWFAQGVLLFLLAAAAWRMEPARAAMLGLVAVFALVLTGRCS